MLLGRLKNNRATALVTLAGGDKRVSAPYTYTAYLYRPRTMSRQIPPLAIQHLDMCNHFLLGTLRINT